MEGRDTVQFLGAANPSILGGSFMNHGSATQAGNALCMLITSRRLNNVQTFGNLRSLGSGRGEAHPVYNNCDPVGPQAETACISSSWYLDSVRLWQRDRQVGYTKLQRPVLLCGVHAFKSRRLCRNAGRKRQSSRKGRRRRCARRSADMWLCRFPSRVTIPLGVRRHQPLQPS